MRVSRRLSLRARGSCPWTSSTRRRWSRRGASSGSAAVRRSSVSVRRGWRPPWSPIGVPPDCCRSESPQHLWGASSASPACPARYPRSRQAQIAYSVSHGFSGIRIDAASAVDKSTWEKEIGRATQEALRALSDGSNPLVFTATGPNDTSVGGPAAGGRDRRRLDGERERPDRLRPRPHPRRRGP